MIVNSISPIAVFTNQHLHSIIRKNNPLLRIVKIVYGCIPTHFSFIRKLHTQFCTCSYFQSISNFHTNIRTDFKTYGSIRQIVFFKAKRNHRIPILV